MSQNSSGQRPRYFLPLLGFFVLATGAAFFWSNLKSPPNSITGSSVAFAAPAPPAPQGAFKPKPATKAEAAAAQKTVSNQLHAFNNGNWKEAVKFQSDGLKQNFPTPEAFGQMIERTYPAFVHAKKVEFGSAFNISGHIQLEVSLTGYDDSVTRALYSLTKEKGNYRIESVMGGSAPQPSDGGGNSTVV